MTFETLGLDSVNLARALRYAAQKQNLIINMTQIHKLLYIAYGAYLVDNKKRLTEEQPSAWPYGPVFPRVHRHVKLFEDITSSEYDRLKESNPDVVALLDEVVKVFGNLSAGALSAWSHQPNSPWDIAVKSSNGVWNTKLNDDDIYNFFFSFLKQTSNGKEK